MTNQSSGDGKLVLGVSDFVAVLNQTLEFAYPAVAIRGELANYRVSKNRWVYFDLKDDQASVKFFGTVYNLPGPLEDGLMLEVYGQPRLHPQYGFSVTIQYIQPVGEGSLKRTAILLEAKLQKEGLFDSERKRILPHPPKRIGLITSSESAAFSDFIKILNERWRGIEVCLFDVRVQGDKAVEDIVGAVKYFNQDDLLDVIVITRGGGSAEDLAAFNTEQITRAVAGSRTPTLVAIGHEIDYSLAELAADQRASTPSNAAELLVPDQKQEAKRLVNEQRRLKQLFHAIGQQAHNNLLTQVAQLHQLIQVFLTAQARQLQANSTLLAALSPNAVLRRGYAIIRRGDTAIRSGKELQSGQTITAELQDAQLFAQLRKVNLK